MEQELQSTKLRALEAEAKLDVQQKDLQRLRKQREEEMQNCSHSMDLEAVKLQEVMCLNLELQARVQALEAELRTRPSRTLKPDVHQVDCEAWADGEYIQEAPQMSKIDIEEHQDDEGSEGSESRADSIYSAYPRGRALRRSESPEMQMVYWWRPRTSTPRPGGSRACQRCLSS